MKQGFNLIELTVSIVLAGVILYPAVTIFFNSAVKAPQIENITVAQSLAEGKLEETLVKDFSAIGSVAETNYSGELSQFSYQVLVDYVTQADLNATAGGATDYKRIRVEIRHPLLSNAVELTSLRADY